jgi:perosamine synthetase
MYRGEQKMNQFIPLSVPNLKGNELKYVTEAIQSEWVSTGGSFIEAFEKNMAKYLKVQGAVACQSGTAGIHLALITAGVDKEDEVIVPTLTFIAAVNPVRYVGATPVFMDCDDTLTIDPYKLESFCKNECILEESGLINKYTHKRIKAIVVVHVFGNIANMDTIMEIAKRYHLYVIEDATEALGTYYTEGKYKGHFAGTIGDFGIYSFNGNKIITTGGGGMLVAKEESALNKTKYLSTQAKDDELYYIHDEIGYNYRMTNLQAAVGVAQLEQLEGFIEIKKNNYELYFNEIKRIPHCTLMPFVSEIRPNYWFYSLKIDFSKIEISKEEFIKQLSCLNIQTRPIWGLIHEQKPYINCQTYHIEKAATYYEQVINIPCSSNLSQEDAQYVIKSIESIL